MAHNGSRLQVNFWFLSASGTYPFLNHTKTAQAWGFVSTGQQPLPDSLNSDGFPISISNGGVYTVFFIPTQTYRAGNYVIGWEGGGTIRRNFTNTILEGSTTNLSGGVWNGANGRCKISLGGAAASTGSIDLGITAIDVAHPITNWWFVHEDDEIDFLAGELFNPACIERLRNFGVIRFLDWQFASGSLLNTWNQMKQESSFSWTAPVCGVGMYRGETTNVGDAFTIDGGAAPTDKQTISVLWNASAATDTPTLNGVTIGNGAGDSLGSTTRPLDDYVGTLVYDADLNIWLKAGGDTANLHVRGVANMVPISVMLKLCKEVGAHPWLHVPFMALDPLTDFATELATACKEYAEAEAPWMVPRFEPSNEVWNPTGGFAATRYAWNKAQVRAGWGGGDFQTHEWYGRVLSLMGEAVSDVYEDDRSKYQVICSVQTHSGATSSSNSRLGGKHVSVDGGDPASDWATHVAMANYFSPTLSATDELQLAHDYNGGDTTAPADLIDSLSVNANFGVPLVLGRVTDWKSWATSFGLGLTFYEGGYSPDYLGSNMTATITGASKATQCVLTLASGSSFPPVGSSVSIASVGGMTELNGNTIGRAHV